MAVQLATQACSDEDIQQIVETYPDFAEWWESQGTPIPKANDPITSCAFIFSGKGWLASINKNVKKAYKDGYSQGCSDTRNFIGKN